MYLSCLFKFLGLTGDSASSNDVTARLLKRLCPHFRGEAARVRCFCHVVNLVAKALLKLFDPPPKKKNSTNSTDYSDSAVLDEIDQALRDLEAELDEEDGVVMAEQGAGGEMLAVDNIEGLVDETEEMSDEERSELRKTVRPVRLALTKVGLHISCLYMLCMLN